MFRGVFLEELCVILGFPTVDFIFVLFIVFVEFGVLVGFGFEEFVFGKAFGFECWQSLVGSVVQD